MSDKHAIPETDESFHYCYILFLFPANGRLQLKFLLGSDLDHETNRIIAVAAISRNYPSITAFEALTGGSCEHLASFLPEL